MNAVGSSENKRNLLLRLIAGSGRSGTTWLLDSVADANALRPVFEPLNTETSAVGNKFGYAYLTRDTECHQLKRLFSTVARGTLSTIWTDYRVKLNRLSPGLRHLRSRTELKALAHRWLDFAKRIGAYRERRARTATIAKCIRANLMLDWVHANFDARILLLMRHPGAAVESRQRFIEHWDPFPLLDRYRNDPSLMSGPLSIYADNLRRDFTGIEALTAIWCIENLVPASQAAANGYVVVFYEELLKRPEAEWPRLVKGLGLDGVPTAQALAEPSQQSAVRLQHCSSNGELYSRNYGSWRERLTREELSQIGSVLELFGVEFYRISELHPDTGAFTRRYLTNAGSRSHAPALQIP